MNASVISPLPPDTNRGPAINVVLWACVSLSILFIGTRLFTRIYITRNPGLGDVFMILSLIFLIVSVSVVTIAVKHGLGRHKVYLDPHDVAYVLYLSTIFEPIAVFSYIFPKIAVVLLIMNLMGPRRQGLWFLYFLLCILFVSSSLSIIFPFVQCNPPSHFWHPMSPAVCWSPNVLRDTTIFAGSWSAFVDLCLSAFPSTLLWNLQIKLKHKIGLSFLMGLGILAMICAIIKTAQLPEVESPDFTWALYTAVVWTFIESTAVIICACIPTLPQLFYLLIRRRATPSQQRGLTRSSRSNYSNNFTDSNSNYNKILNSARTRKTDSTDNLALATISHVTVTQLSDIETGSRLTSDHAVS